MPNKQTVIGGDVLLATQIGFSTAFQKAFDTAPDQMPLLANDVQSAGKSEQYKWPSDLPVMEEATGGDMIYEKPGVNTWQIDNKTYRTGLEIPREDIEDDRLGIWGPYVAAMGEEARLHPYRLLVTLLEAGFTTTCFDGQAFFSASHKDLGANFTYANLITPALGATGWHTAKQTMRRFKDAKGRALNLRPTHLIVPPELENAGQQVLTVDRLANGATNPDYKSAELIVEPLLTDTGKWYAACLDRRLKPFVYQKRVPPELVAQDRPTDEVAMAQDVFRWKLRARYNIGFGLPKFIVASNATT